MKKCSISFHKSKARHFFQKNRYFSNSLRNYPSPSKTVHQPCSEAWFPTLSPGRVSLPMPVHACVCVYTGISITVKWGAHTTEGVFNSLLPWWPFLRLENSILTLAGSAKRIRISSFRKFTVQVRSRKNHFQNSPFLGILLKTNN